MNYFIPADRLGVLENNIKQITEMRTKRKRQIEFGIMARVLHGLKLIPRELKIIGLAYGMGRDGELGLFVETERPVHESVQLPGESHVD